MFEWISTLPFSQAELGVHTLVIVINLLLFAFAKPLVSIFTSKPDDGLQLSVFRVLNFFFFFFHLIDLGLIILNQDYQNFFSNLALMLVSIYFSVFLFSFLSFLSRKKFGLEKKLDEKTLYIETYNSRLVDIIILVFISVISLYIIIDIWDFDSLLQTTGIFGIAAAFLALTNQIWAPDMFYGLVILNSKMLEDGDVIQFGDNSDEYIINKVTFIYTILLDVRNNHRTLIKNSKLVDHRVDNLSKKASTDGLRMKLSYKIGYPKKEEIQDFKKRINEMFEEVNSIALADDEIKINENIPFEWYLHETGDYALEYNLFFYIDSLPNTKVTKTVR
ncbi:mechanosensitive ion channel family protein, partial [Sulfurimonas sp. MAG313]